MGVTTSIVLGKIFISSATITAAGAATVSAYVAYISYNNFDNKKSCVYMNSVSTQTDEYPTILSGDIHNTITEKKKDGKPTKWSSYFFCVR